jgi:hypothetical protein
MLAEMMPLPSEETTPPVTNMYFVSINKNMYLWAAKLLIIP